MRSNLVHTGAGELNYEIRNIVNIANKVSALTQKNIYWENIGDPVSKGEILPKWIKEIVSNATLENDSYAYSPTLGLLKTREFLADQSNKQGGVFVKPDDIIFFNGLGDAITKVYNLLTRSARVIGPSPSYPSHSSAEAGHAASAPITYNLLPHKGWLPDMVELHQKVKYNDSIAGLMIINPDNPTGVVFPKEIISEMVAIAKKYKLFIVADEIYSNMVYNNKENYEPLSKLIGDVPALSLKGISKELPWPGSRCGWITVYNRDKDENFDLYVRGIINAKMLEVCSTTLPQKVIPSILGHRDYKNWQNERNNFYKKRSEQVGKIFAENNCDEVYVNPPDGAFYVSFVFKNKLTNKMRIKIENNKVKEYILPLIENKQPDYSFVYQLLGATNICAVPLSSFVTELEGFRCTLLEKDDETFNFIFNTIAKAVKEFVNS